MGIRTLNWVGRVENPLSTTAYPTQTTLPSTSNSKSNSPLGEL